MASGSFPINREKKPHVIEEISFRKDTVLCTCSFAGTISEYDAHRREWMALREDERRRRREAQSA